MPRCRSIFAKRILNGPFRRPHPRSPLTVPIAIALVLVLGGTLIFSATRATASVEDGTRFIKWMLVVFACFLILAALPIVIAF